MISPKIKWNHDQNLFVPKVDAAHMLNMKKTIVNISEKNLSFMQGHVIDGKILFPGTAIVDLVWKCFAEINDLVKENCAVTLEDVKFLRATSLTMNQDVIFAVNIHKGFSSAQWNIELFSQFYFSFHSHRSV
jgi:fatty acid synthase, animal type